MRILLIHNFYQQFGGEDLVASQERERLQKDHDVYFYSRHNDEIRDYGLIDKLKFPLNALSSRRTERELTSVISEFRPDFAYVHNIYPLISPSVYRVLSRAGVPILQVMHDYRPLCANGWFYIDREICTKCSGGSHWSALRNKCYRNSYAMSGLYAAVMAYAKYSGAWNKVDAYLCLTEFSKRLLLDSGIRAEKIFVRPNTIDVSNIVPRPGEGTYVGFIGRLSSEKGIWTLVRAFERLREPILKIAGTGPLQAELREYVREKGLANVEFVGFVSGTQKWDFLVNSLFTVMPSEWHETFGLTLLEAYAAGKPVIASSLGAMSSIVEHGKSGLLFPAGSVDELAKSIDMLYRSPELVGRMGTYARALVETRYSPQRGYTLLREIVEQVRRRHADETLYRQS